MTVKATTAAIMRRQDRRGGVRQMDLFSAGVADGAPTWPDLLEDARDTLISLMTQLILGHSQASRTSSAMEAGHDF